AVAAERLVDQAEAALDVLVLAVDVLPEVRDVRRDDRLRDEHAVDVAELVDHEDLDLVRLTVLQTLDAEAGRRRVHVRAADVRGVELLEAVRRGGHACRARARARARAAAAAGIRRRVDATVGEQARAADLRVWIERAQVA